MAHRPRELKGKRSASQTDSIKRNSNPGNGPVSDIFREVAGCLTMLRQQEPTAFAVDA